VPESLDAVLTANRVKFVYLVPTFQNPTGRTLPLDRRKAVAEILRKHDTLLIEDDPYSDLRYTGEPVPPIKSLAPDHVVYSSTLSKTFAPGLRLGLCVGPAVIQRWLVTARQGVDLHTSTFAQALAAEYVSAGYLERQLPRILALYAPRQQAMIEALAAHLPEDFRFTRPEGGMFIWVEGPKGFDAEALQAKLLERGVAFVPGKYFYVNPEGNGNTFRMNFTAAGPETIERAITIMGDVIAGS
jgi:2-aminoadipate transaminase